MWDVPRQLWAWNDTTSRLKFGYKSPSEHSESWYIKKKKPVVFSTSIRVSLTRVIGPDDCSINYHNSVVGQSELPRREPQQARSISVAPEDGTHTWSRREKLATSPRHPGYRPGLANPGSSLIRLKPHRVTSEIVYCWRELCRAMPSTHKYDQKALSRQSTLFAQARTASKPRQSTASTVDCERPFRSLPRSLT